MTQIDVTLPLESDTWDSYPATLTFTVNDDTVEIQLVGPYYATGHAEKDREARIVTIDKAEFLKLLRVVQL